MNLYFAHGFHNRQNGKALQKVIETTWPEIKLLNPFYDRDRPEMKEIDEGLRDRYDVPPKDIVESDLDTIDGADGVFAWIDENVKYGTSMEVFYASVTLALPVVLLVTNGDEKHPWLQYCSDYIAKDHKQLQGAFNLLLKEFKE